MAKKENSIENQLIGMAKQIEFIQKELKGTDFAEWNPGQVRYSKFKILQRLYRRLSVYNEVVACVDFYISHGFPRPFKHTRISIEKDIVHEGFLTMNSKIESLKKNKRLLKKMGAEKTIEALKAAGVRDKVKVMVGGAPTTAEWAAQIGADAHAKDGPMAAIVAAELVGKS